MTFKVGDKVRFKKDGSLSKAENKARRDSGAIGTIEYIRDSRTEIDFSDGLPKCNLIFCIINRVIELAPEEEPKTELEKVRAELQQKIEAQINLIQTGALAIEESEGKIRSEQEYILTVQKDIDGANLQIEELNEIVAKLTTKEEPFPVNSEVMHDYYGLGRVVAHLEDSPLIHVQFFNRTGTFAIPSFELVKAETKNSITFQIGEQVIHPSFGVVTFNGYNFPSENSQIIRQNGLKAKVKTSALKKKARFTE